MALRLLVVAMPISSSACSHKYKYRQRQVQIQIQTKRQREAIRLPAVAMLHIFISRQIQRQIQGQRQLLLQRQRQRQRGAMVAMSSNGAHLRQWKGDAQMCTRCTHFYCTIRFHKKNSTEKQMVNMTMHWNQWCRGRQRCLADPVTS